MRDRDGAPRSAGVGAGVRTHSVDGTPRSGSGRARTNRRRSELGAAPSPLVRRPAGEIPVDTAIDEHAWPCLRSQARTPLQADVILIAREAARPGGDAAAGPLREWSEAVSRTRGSISPGAAEPRWGRSGSPPSASRRLEGAVTRNHLEAPSRAALTRGSQGGRSHSCEQIEERGASVGVVATPRAMRRPTPPTATRQGHLATSSTSNEASLWRRPPRALVGAR